jgi:hypothetical protein
MKTLQLSGSLSAFLILTIIMIGAFWFWIKKSNFLKKKLIKHRIIYLIFITLALIFLILYTERYTSIESKILSLQFRFDTWESAIKIFKDYPLTGAGMGEFYNYHIQNMKSGGEITRFAHNLALNLLSQCGLFGGIAALSMLFHPIFLLFLVKKEKLIIGSKSTYIATFLGGIAWSLHSLLNFNIQVPATICTFLILPSFSLSFPKNRKVLPIKNNIALSFCCLILIGFSLIPTTRLSGEKKYKILEKLIENGASKSEIYEIGEMAITSLSNSPYPTSRIALFALHEGDYEIAINKLKESIKRTPHRSSYHYWIAYVYAKIGKIDESYSSIESALFWYPSNKNYIQLKEYLDALKSQ